MVTKKPSQRWLILISICLIAVTASALTLFSNAAPLNTVVDFNQMLTDQNSSITNLAAKPFSSTISTYAETGQSIITSSKQRTMLANLGAGYYRVPLQWNGGNIVSSAGGHPSGSGDAWIDNIKAIGAQPQIVIGGSADNNFVPSDAANLVRHFNAPTTGRINRVDVWVIGNEPNNGGMSMADYCNLFINTVNAMKAVDPTIKVAGPAWSYYDGGQLRQFLQCAGNLVDIIDYHHYAMGVTWLSTAQALQETANWENEVLQLRAAINELVPTRKSQIEIQVGEFNWSWRTGDGYNGWQGDDRFYQAINTVWSASVAGHIVKAGGRGHQYADQNGALGITFEKNDAALNYGRQLNDPMPIYFGLQMFSGGNLFRGFGTLPVVATTSLPNVEIFASANYKNIVMINKSPDTAQTASLSLMGYDGGTVDIWQTNKDLPFDAPAKKATLNPVTTGLEFGLPPYSVTTFVLHDSNSQPITGDFDGDGHVAGHDLSLLLGKFNQSWPAYDLDNDIDHIITGHDLSILLAKFGS